MKLNRIVLSNFKNGQLNKYFLIMRLTWVLILILSLPTSASVWSQTLSVKLKKSTLQELFQQIEKSSQYRFFYNNDDVNVNQRISIDLEEETVGNILTNAFNGLPYSFKELENKLILVEKRDDKLDFTLPGDQQQRKITGKVTDQSGVSLPGVSVVIKGTTIGTLTDATGKYAIDNAPQNATLIFSFVGTTTQEIPSEGRKVIDVVMKESTIGLDEVVVTALGIEKNKKSIAYATQRIGRDALNVVPQANFINSLSGKVAGVTISNSAGVGGSATVLIRGNKSINQNNQPLYVIDGIPMANNISSSNNATFSSSDRGDYISNINTNDIESINILKGASAAALYGSAAANGAILITTKKGQAGVSRVTYNSSFMMDKVAYVPEIQNSYGQTNPGSMYSWGSAITNAQDNISGFFKTGTNLVNSISISSGSEKVQSYISYANTIGNGILENNTLSRHNFDIKEIVNLFDNKLKIEVNGTFAKQTLNSPPTSGLQMNNIKGLYLFPRGLDFAQYKTPEIFDPVRKLNIMNWFIQDNVDTQNPYWLTNYDKTKVVKSTYNLNINATYHITRSLNIQVRGKVDRIGDVTDTRYYVGTPQIYAGTNGYYGLGIGHFNQNYGDAILNYSKSLGKIQFYAVLGSSILDQQSDGMSAGSRELYVPNVFTLSNMDLSSQKTGLGQADAGHSQIQSVFGNLNASYNDWLFLDVTGRNDWSSNLSYTPNGSYYYPSFGLSTILNKLLTLPEIISFAKLRATYAVVGNTVPLYVTHPLNSVARGGSIVRNTTTPFEDLNPEKTKSWELGTELRLFKDQVTVDFTYYKANSTNQFFVIAVPPGTGFTSRYINGGDIQNSGIELSLGYTTLSKKSFQWSTLFNISTNKNVVKELAKDVDQFVLFSDNNNYSVILKPGGSYGDIYGYSMQRDSASGKVIIGNDGVPRGQSGTPKFLGNPNPKFQIGWNNSFTYKNFSFSFLIDGKFGGKVFSMTQQLLDAYGISKASGDARDNGGVTVNGMLADGTPVTQVDAYKWYYNSIASNHLNSENMYDATVIKLRELSIRYSLPNTMFKKGFIKDMQLSLIAKNLAYLYKPAPYDPELTYSPGSILSGVDVMMLPATRSFGASLSISF